MSHIPAPPDDEDGRTRASLMDGIRDRDNAEAWRRYWNTYEPLIRTWCRDASVAASDLDEVISMVLTKIVQTMKRGWVYNPQRRYRGWLWTVCKSQIREFQRQRAGDPALATGNTGIHEEIQSIPAPPEAESTENALAILVERATAIVRERIGPTSPKWLCFQWSALEGRKGAAIANELQIDVGLVHQNKSRVFKAIRDEAERLRDQQS